MAKRRKRHRWGDVEEWTPARALKHNFDELVTALKYADIGAANKYMGRIIHEGRGLRGKNRQLAKKAKEAGIKAIVAFWKSRK